MHIVFLGSTIVLDIIFLTWVRKRILSQPVETNVIKDNETNRFVARAIDIFEMLTTQCNIVAGKR
jgi:hypothetical protein